MIKKVLFFGITMATCCPLYCFSQEAEKNTGTGINIHYGFIMPHHATVAYLVKNRVKAAEINIIRQHEGSKEWEKTYHHPQTGISIIYADLGNPEQIGNLFGLSPFINFPFKKNKTINWNIKVNTGLCYVTKKFDPINNHKNIVIATNLNALIQLGLNARFCLSKYFRLETGLNIMHFSNGAFQMPNLGINIPTLHAGLIYLPYLEPEKTNSAPVLIEKTWDYNIYAGTGLTEIEPIGGKKFNVYTFSMSSLKTLNQKSKVGAGVDIFYNNANILKLEEDSVFLKNKIQNIQNGIKFCYELTIGKLSIPLEMGFYTYTRVKNNGFIYNQFGLKYKPGKHFFTELILKTHFAKADFTEIGIGYTLN